MRTIKVMAFLLSSTLALSAQAQENLDNVILLSGGFGIDGATNEPMPRDNSIDQAKEIFDNLKIEAIEENGKIKKQLYTLEFTEDGVNFTLLVSGTSEKSIFGDSNEDFTFQLEYMKAISFVGPIANELYDAMSAKETVRAGGSTKKLANLTCVKSMGARMALSYTCSLKGTGLSAMRGKTLKDAAAEAPKEFNELLKLFGLN